MVSFLALRSVMTGYGAKRKSLALQHNVRNQGISDQPKTGAQWPSPDPKDTSALDFRLASFQVPCSVRLAMTAVIGAGLSAVL